MRRRVRESGVSRFTSLQIFVRASIVIPALNEEKNLGRSLPLIRRQLGPEDEIIVVDNGSTDNTAAVAAGYGAKVIKEPVRNRSRSRNAGFRNSEGQFVVFLDGDCFPEDHWLERLLAPFSDQTIGCVAGEIRILNTAGHLENYLSEKGYLSQADNFRHPFLPYAGGANLAFRRSVLERIGLFDEQLFSGHDADLCWRMQLETDSKIVLIANAAVAHYQKASWRALFQQKRRHAHGAVLLYKKYRTKRAKERQPLKHTYWEYRSILKRAGQFVWQRCRCACGLGGRVNATADYQLLLEVAEKFGRIEGSLRHCVWFP